MVSVRLEGGEAGWDGGLLRRDIQARGHAIRHVAHAQYDEYPGSSGRELCLEPSRSARRAPTSYDLWVVTWYIGTTDSSMPM